MLMLLIVVIVKNSAFYFSNKAVKKSAWQRTKINILFNNAKQTKDQMFNSQIASTPPPTYYKTFYQLWLSKKGDENVNYKSMRNKFVR